MSACCIHCDEVLNAKERAEGWCDSCGKKLPSGQRRTWKRRAPVTREAPPVDDGMPWYLTLLAGAILLVAGSFIFTLMAGERTGATFFAKGAGKAVGLLIVALVIVVFRTVIAGVRGVFRLIFRN